MFLTVLTEPTGTGSGVLAAASAPLVSWAASTPFVAGSAALEVELAVILSGIEGSRATKRGQTVGEGIAIAE